VRSISAEHRGTGERITARRIGRDEDESRPIGLGVGLKRADRGDGGTAALVRQVAADGVGSLLDIV
jgi:hypothetical protein